MTELEYTYYGGSPFMDFYQIHEILSKNTEQEEKNYLCDLWVPTEGKHAGEEFYAVPLSAETKWSHWELMEMFPQLPRIEYPRKGRPRIPPAEKRVKVAIALTPEHHAKTAKNRSKIIAEALKYFFEKT